MADIECPECNGTGKTQKMQQQSTGRKVTETLADCPKCGGKGKLRQ